MHVLLISSSSYRSIDRSIDLHFQARRYRFTFSFSTRKVYYCCLFICIVIETNLSKKKSYIFYDTSISLITSISIFLCELLIEYYDIMYR